MENQTKDWIDIARDILNPPGETVRDSERRYVVSTLTTAEVREWAERYSYNVTLQWGESGGNSDDLVELEHALFDLMSNLRAIERIHANTLVR